MKHEKILQLGLILASTILRPIAGTLRDGPDDYAGIGDIQGIFNKIDLDLQRSNHGTSNGALTLDLLMPDHAVSPPECNLVLRDYGKKITVIVNVVEAGHDCGKLAIQQIAIASHKSLRLEDIYIFKATHINDRIKFDATDEFLTSEWQDRLLSGLYAVQDAHLLDENSTKNVTFLARALETL